MKKALVTIIILALILVSCSKNKENNSEISNMEISNAEIPDTVISFIPDIEFSNPEIPDIGISLYYADQGEAISIKDNRLEIHRLNDYDYVETIESYALIPEFVNGFLYISFNYTGKFLNTHDWESKDSKITEYPHGRTRLLVLYTVTPKGESKLSLYNENNNLVYSASGGRHNIFAGETQISATSELREKNTVYEAKTLWDTRTLKPWVEGVEGSGIGEKIRIDYQYIIFRFHGLIISNGFVDYNRPHLYQENNRVKKIRVGFGDTGTYKDYTLEDTPFYQRIDFEGEENAKYITIEILEVYEGTKYNDTCINQIISLAY